MSDSTANPAGLTDRQKRALPYLAVAPSIQDACRQAKIRPDTYYRWLKEPIFVNALKKQQNELVTDAMNCFRVNIGRAVATLVSLLDSENDFLKRSVANDIITHFLKYRELSEIEERLETVEKIVMERRTYKP
jgi:activator of 2-hydroxyglutaryl-CoA dehydratase